MVFFVRHILMQLYTDLSMRMAFFIKHLIRVRDTRTGYLIPVRDALWGPARMDVLFPRRRRRRRRRWRRRHHSENSG